MPGRTLPLCILVGDHTKTKGGYPPATHPPTGCSAYLGMDRNRFNAEVRPYLTKIPIGRQGIAFDRLELDAWVDDYVSRNGRPAERSKIWDARKSPGLKKRGRIWWIDKRVKGYGRVAESCGTTNLAEAEQYLAFRLNEIRNAMVYGIRPTRTFQQAAIKYPRRQSAQEKLLERYLYAFDRVMPHIGHLAAGSHSQRHAGQLSPGPSRGRSICRHDQQRIELYSPDTESGGQSLAPRQRHVVAGCAAADRDGEGHRSASPIR